MRNHFLHLLISHRHWYTTTNENNDSFTYQFFFQIEHQAFGSKTSDTVINCENDDDLMLKENFTLSESGVKNETEISFFKLEDYLEYKKATSS